MTVRDGQIILRRQGQMTTAARDMLMDSFQSLLSIDHNDSPELAKVAYKLATDLFMYTYYLNGFEFSYMSYGNLFGTQFLRTFPEYIQGLRNMQTMPITEIDIDRFITQFTLKNKLFSVIFWVASSKVYCPLKGVPAILEEKVPSSLKEMKVFSAERPTC